MFVKVFIFTALLGICAAFCGYSWSENGCEYSGQRFQAGETILTKKDCMRCTCLDDGKGMNCCSAGNIYITYPDTCKVIKDQNECERLVLKSDESTECTAAEGPISAKG